MAFKNQTIYRVCMCYDILINDLASAYKGGIMVETHGGGEGGGGLLKIRQTRKFALVYF